MRHSSNNLYLSYWAPKLPPTSKERQYRRQAAQMVNTPGHLLRLQNNVQIGPCFFQLHIFIVIVY